jgi:hypothetical protein
MGMKANNEHVRQGFFRGIPSNKAESFFTQYPIALQWITDALKHDGGLTDLAFVRKSINEQESQLWAFFDADGFLTAILITNIGMTPSGVKRLTAHVIAGRNMPLWVDAMNTLLSDFARANDCEVIIGYGRKGWQKTLKRLGWKDHMIVFYKKV